MQNYEHQRPVYWETDSEGRRVYRLAVGNTYDELIDSIGRIVAERQGYKPPEQTITPEAPVIKFNEYAMNWLEVHAKPRQQPNTYACEISRVRKWIKAFGDKPIDTITFSDVQKVLNGMSGRKKAYIVNVLNALARILDIAKEDGYVTENVAKSKHIFNTGKPKGKRRVLTGDEIAHVQNVLATMDDSDDKLFMAIALYTGARPGEVLALEWSDIDFTKKTILINKALASHGSRSEIGGTKTESGVRTLPLVPQLERILRPHQGIGLIFHKPNGKPFKTYDREKLTERIEVLLNIGHLTPYTFRHTFATKLSESGLNNKALQAYMGHANFSTTMNTYVHPTDAMLNEAGVKAAELFDRFSKTGVNE